VFSGDCLIFSDMLKIDWVAYDYKLSLSNYFSYFIRVSVEPPRQ
jgi:hypothetical protein